MSFYKSILFQKYLPIWKRVLLEMDEMEMVFWKRVLLEKGALETGAIENRCLWK